MSEFDLGPQQGFSRGDDFILYVPEWSAVTDYVRNLATISMADIPFADVRAQYEAMQAQTKTWTDTTFPSLVELAGDVVHHAQKVSSYLPALEQVLGQLGQSPSEQLGKKCDAIISVLQQSIEGAIKSASAAKDAVIQFVNTAQDEKAKLDILHGAYAKLYLAQDSPGELQFAGSYMPALIQQLADAWMGTARTLEKMQDWVDAQVATGEPFQVDISFSEAVEGWKTLSQQADVWRSNAYVTT